MDLLNGGLVGGYIVDLIDISALDTEISFIGTVPTIVDIVGRVDQKTLPIVDLHAKGDNAMTNGAKNIVFQLAWGKGIGDVEGYLVNGNDNTVGIVAKVVLGDEHNVDRIPLRISYIGNLVGVTILRTLDIPSVKKFVDIVSTGIELELLIGKIVGRMLDTRLRLP